MATDTKPGSATRRFLLWAALVGCLVMAVVCVIPTFLGPEAAEAWFVSPFGATVWWAFGLLIVVSMVAIQALRRRLGLLAMHLGMVLVIVGAMWGSPMMHRVRESLWDDPKQYKGFLVVEEGGHSSRLLDSHERPIAQLPFEVHLERFWIEYYPVAVDDLWVFILEATAPGEQPAMGQAWRSIRVDWKPGEPARLPFCDIDLLVTDYTLMQYGSAPDAPVLPEAKLVLSRGTHRTEEVFAPQPGMPVAQLPLAGLYDSAKDWHDAGMPYLRFRPPMRVIKDFKSALVVHQDGQDIARKTIEVNDPLHVGGYHFYQHDYDHTQGRYTVLAVASDSGLSLVYVGFILLAGGLALHVLLPKRKARPRSAETDLSEGGV